MTQKFRQTKIIATLGPASDSEDMITALINAGVNVFRLNFSHGDHSVHRRNAKRIRDISEQLKANIAIIADLQGPKIRIGAFKDGSIDLNIGQTLRLDNNSQDGDKNRVYLPHPEIIEHLQIGQRIFFDDGKVRAIVKERFDDALIVEIEAGSNLSSRKGLNTPDTTIPFAALTDKDKIDLDIALDIGADWIAQSFVQTAQDVQEAKDLINGRAALMVKIEKPSALSDLSAIVDLCDGVMLARGDLGVEIPPEEVPSAQKRVIRHVRNAGKPIVVATQMLESMIENPRPTRAEASDVATAVYDGADAVMLSAETAAGNYPLEAVSIMARICEHSESDELYEHSIDLPDADISDYEADAITAAAHLVADDIQAQFIVTYTQSGSTALRMVRQRPAMPILCLTPHNKVARRLSLSYGVQSHYSPETLDEDFKGPARHAAKIAKNMQLGKTGDSFIMTAGVPFGVTGSTNMLRIAKID